MVCMECVILPCTCSKCLTGQLKRPHPETYADFTEQRGVFNNNRLYIGIRILIIIYRAHNHMSNSDPGQDAEQCNIEKDNESQLTAVYAQDINHSRQLHMHKTSSHTPYTTIYFTHIMQGQHDFRQRTYTHMHTRNHVYIDSRKSYVAYSFCASLNTVRSSVAMNTFLPTVLLWCASLLNRSTTCQFTFGHTNIIIEYYTPFIIGLQIDMILLCNYLRHIGFKRIQFSL